MIESIQVLEGPQITIPDSLDLNRRTCYDFTSVPETCVVDQEGKLALRKVSPFLSVDEARTKVEALLAK